MATFMNNAGSFGDIGILVNGRKPALSWQIENNLRMLRGNAGVLAAKLLSKLTGIPTLISELSIKVTDKNGNETDYGVVCRRVVTDVGADKIALAFNAGFTLANFNYHGVGTGTTAEAAGDTTLVTESTTILNPDSTRATGTQTNPATKQYRSVGTLTFDGSGAITEHGLFSQAATGGGSLFDRSVFSAINVASGDSIQFTYTLSVTSGG